MFFSHLPFRYSKKSSCGRTLSSMYSVAMPADRTGALALLAVAPAPAAAGADAFSALTTLATSARVKALRRCFFMCLSFLSR
ncbi:hypothetical protein [Massilia sp. Se16.2.3]|uniref:hypothetical protein n=1 Tax=Massilia sp. Se16.2.3 TaxID=2709303 RepID=UPI001E39F4E6|nr:hypothetical protein [Massilia sp. Se16.2.3]